VIAALPPRQNRDIAHNMNQSFLHIRRAVAEFEDRSVIYAFRFGNGRTKVGLSRSILSRARNYHLHGANDLEHVTLVTIADEWLREAEYIAHERYRAETKRVHDRETFESLSAERDVEILGEIGRNFDDLCILRSTMPLTDAKANLCNVHTTSPSDEDKPAFPPARKFRRRGHAPELVYKMTDDERRAYLRTIKYPSSRRS